MKTALILIDLQNDYFPGGARELVHAERAAENARCLLDQCRQLDLPVIHLQHIADRPGATFFLPDTIGVKLHELLQPLVSETVLQKHYPNSFRDTNLNEILRGYGVDRLFFSGMMSHMCVDATVRAAFDAGFACVVAHDACATMNLQFAGQVIEAEKVHGSFMAALGAVYAEVVTTKECVQLLSTPVS